MNDDSFIPASRMSKRQATLSFGTVVATKRAKVDSPPFSLETFSANLSTAPPKGSSGSVSVRELLALECETLDESWIAGLSKELEKPYFLKLKQFLWEEGVRGVGGTEVKGKKKVFPPGSSRDRWEEIGEALLNRDLGCSGRYLRLVEVHDITECQSSHPRLVRFLSNPITNETTTTDLGCKRSRSVPRR